MKLIAYSITHHNCPVKLRERLFLSADRRKSILRRMHTNPSVSEALLLQTCNRTEFYLYVKKNFDCTKFLTSLLTRFNPDSVNIWKEYHRFYQGLDVVRHLFEVAAGLDSQILGENQILAQLKSAYTESINARMSRMIFHRLFHSAFRVGKAVRAKTKISTGPVSVALAAVELAKKQAKLQNSHVLLIGAGRNAQLLAKYLLKSKPKSMTIANRTPKKAKSLLTKSADIKAIPLRNVSNCLSGIDLLISTTASRKPVLTYQSVKNILIAREKPLLIIDIAVPRDIDPKVSRLKSVRLYNIDDLKKLVKTGAKKRSAEILNAKAVVNEFTDKFVAWFLSLDLAPVISRLNRTALELARDHAARYAKEFAKADGNNLEERIKVFAESLAKKLLHSPISFLRQEGTAEPTTEQLRAADLLNKIFLSKSKELRK